MAGGWLRDRRPNPVRLGDQAGALPLRAAATAAAAVFAVVASISVTNAWRDIEHQGFDALSVVTAKNRSTLPITIVGIDEASFAEIGKRWPWPRRLHAQLIDRLTQAGALVIAMDVLLSEASEDAEDDRILAESIRASGRVVLAADMSFHETAYARQWLRVDPLPAFTGAGASSGLANVAPDGDLVVRRMPEGRDVLWREVTRLAAARLPGVIVEPPSLADTMIRYAGPNHTFPYVSYYQALDADRMLPEGAFRDQVVIVGFDVKSSPGDGATHYDNFATPFTSRTHWLTPGAEIHANALETGVLVRAIRPAPAPAGLVVALAAIAGSALLLRRWRPVSGAAIAAALAAMLGLLSYALFRQFDFWLPVMAAVLGVAGVYAAFGMIAYLGERARRAEARRAFSMYVAPEVVDEMLAHPERLKLGGDRREITVLFTDLAGFTTLSEQLGAEQVAGILGEHFTRISAIIKQHRGTITQFNGDAVMAIWGAPIVLGEPASAAFFAALEMQREVARHREALRAAGLPGIRMRIGLHTCTAVVGNLGGADRFTYTAIGDGVNLASRLEGVNKAYGTEILVSADCASRLSAGCGLRPVDRVVVKGKTEPVDVFTPEEDAAIRDATRAAIEAYRRRDWNGAEEAWKAIIAKRPDDGVAGAYLARMAVDRSATLPDDWDGSISLEKL